MAYILMLLLLLLSYYLQIPWLSNCQSVSFQAPMLTSCCRQMPNVSSTIIGQKIIHLHSTFEEWIKVLVKKRRVQLGLKCLKIDETWWNVACVKDLIYLYFWRVGISLRHFTSALFSPEGLSSNTYEDCILHWRLLLVIETWKQKSVWDSFFKWVWSKLSH